MGERRWRAAQRGRPRRRSRRSSATPATTTCCATRCWRTCTARSSTRSRRRRPTTSCSRTSAARTRSWPAGSAGRARRSPTRCGCSSCRRWSSAGSRPACSRPVTPGRCSASTTPRPRSGSRSAIVAEGLSVRAVEEIVSLGGDPAAAATAGQPAARRRSHPSWPILADRLSDRFETRVKVDLGRSRGPDRRGVRLDRRPGADRRADGPGGPGRLTVRRRCASGAGASAATGPARAPEARPGLDRRLCRHSDMSPDRPWPRVTGRPTGGVAESTRSLGRLRRRTPSSPCRRSSACRQVARSPARVVLRRCVAESTSVRDVLPPGPRPAYSAARPPPDVWEGMRCPVGAPASRWTTSTTCPARAAAACSGSSTRWPREAAEEAGDVELEKEAWVSATLLEWGSCGKIVYVDSLAGGLPHSTRRRCTSRAALAFPTSPVVADAVLLMTARVLPEFAGAGLGRMLVQTAAKDLLASRRAGDRGVRSGRRRPTGRSCRQAGCLLPADYLLAVGFKTVRPHPIVPAAAARPAQRAVLAGGRRGGAGAAARVDEPGAGVPAGLSTARMCR